jgi:hypothetical protein
MKYLPGAITGLLLSVHSVVLYPQSPVQKIEGKDTLTTFTLDNEYLTLSIVYKGKQLFSDSLTGASSWFESYGASPVVLSSTADFELTVVWTDWLAPGKKNNGDNPVILSKENFKLISYAQNQGKDGTKEIVFRFLYPGTTLETSVCYSLSPGKFYYRKKIEVTDTLQQSHYLQSAGLLKGSVSATYGNASGITAPVEILNPGGFGQPLAITAGKAGAFFAVEYPTATNAGYISNDSLYLDLHLEVGQKITKQNCCKEWAVIGLLPEPYTQKWFFDYLDDIRCAPAEPYVLYNSWYDLRSPEYPGVKPANVMNEKNVSRIIGLLKKNMIDKHDIKLDGFVLDDGWDVYQSDWKMRTESFPNGLKPLALKLNEMGTGLGIWFGPTGGYSFRMKRIDWMRKQGYETVGKGSNNAMLCLGGKKYSHLLRKRVTDMSKYQGVSYFKWDGIQFSCSEPDHGHAVGIHSRNAILNTLIEQCKAVRAINPSAYLNITSGTWLSPWWVKYANQIWMDGGDYGFADVPSVNMRDAAITYRDFVLYDDFTVKGLWFPTSNLMTHGIIKGNLESVGGQEDPLDKFTNDVVLYFARGISMIELYISPDLLNENEWQAIGKSIHWAKQKKDILARTFMAGGNPTLGEPYAYVHFKGDKGILALRNPVIAPQTINLQLKPEYGLSSKAQSLVIEKVYPYHYILPRLFAPGERVELPLEGFETAIYEVYPVSDALSPLPAACRFDLAPDKGNSWQLKIYESGPASFFHDTVSIVSMQWQGKPLANLGQLPQPRLAPVFTSVPGQNVDPLQPLAYSAIENASSVQVMYLLKPSDQYAGKKMPELIARLDGVEIPLTVEKEKGKWYWVSAPVKPGDHKVQLEMKRKDTVLVWEGTAEIWSKVEYPQYYQPITVQSSKQSTERLFPPSPCKEGNIIKQFRIGEGKIIIH